MLSLAAAVVVGVPITDAHSWVACTDYRGDVNYYEEDKCFGYPRLWANRGANALTATSDGYHIGADTGYNYMPGAATITTTFAHPIHEHACTNITTHVHFHCHLYTTAVPTNGKRQTTNVNRVPFRRPLPKRL